MQRDVNLTKLLASMKQLLGELEGKPNTPAAMNATATEMRKLAAAQRIMALNMRVRRSNPLAIREYGSQSRPWKQ